MLKKLFNVRTGLVVMFAMLLGSYAVLAVILINTVYQSVTTNTKSEITVVERTKFNDGNTIEVPKEITVGKPFVYHVSGKKLVQNGADVRLQIDCTVGEYSTSYTLGTFYSDLPVGKFDLRKQTTIAVSSRLQASDDCYMLSVSTYQFYNVDKDGNEAPTTVREIGKSNRFKLLVPTEPATQPSS